MCGIFGVIESGDEDLINLGIHMGFALQHRGQEAAGIAFTDGGRLMVVERWEGLVSRFGPIQEERLRIQDVRPQAAIGHVRYSNTGSNKRENYQPFVRSTKFGKVAMVHNGNLMDTQKISAILDANGYEPDGTTDSELILLLVAYYSRLDSIDTLEQAIRMAVKNLKGSYSLLFMTKDRLIGLRDPWGIRPLSFGQFNSNGFVFASESCAIRAIGAETICDLKAGEMVVAYIDGHSYKTQFLPSLGEHMCIFEFIYFGLPSSIIHDRSLETARRHMGEQLQREFPITITNPDEWIVGGVPNTGIPAALGFAAASGIEYRRIFLKNEFVGRTFIQPEQRLRELGVRLKLQELSKEVRGKKVVAIEDSIVRATTSPQLVKLLREAGAAEVHMLVASPPYKFSCSLGTDTQNTKELIASKMSVEEIRQYIDADSLTYLSIEGLIRAIDPVPGFGFCTGCFDQNYPIDPREQQLSFSL